MASCTDTIWTVTLRLNSKHDVSFPARISFSSKVDECDEIVMSNWNKFSHDLIQIVLNKFRKYGINKRKCVIFSQNGAELTNIEPGYIPQSMIESQTIDIANACNESGNNSRNDTENNKDENDETDKDCQAAMTARIVPTTQVQALGNESDNNCNGQSANKMIVMTNETKNEETKETKKAENDNFKENTKNGNVTSILSMTLNELENNCCIYDGCTFYISKIGELFSLDKNTIQIQIANKNKRKELLMDDALLIQTLPKKSNKLIGSLIGYRGQNIKYLVGSSNIDGALIIEEEIPHKKSKCKEFERIETQWSKLNQSIKSYDNVKEPQSLIYQTIQSSEISNNKKNNGESNKKEENKPMIVLRGKKSNLEKAKETLNSIVNNNLIEHRHSGYWFNILKTKNNKMNNKRLESLAKHFVRMKGVSKSWFINEERKLRQLIISRGVIDIDEIPCEITFPIIYVRASKDGIDAVTKSLQRRKIQFDQINANQVVSDETINDMEQEQEDDDDDDDAQFRFDDRD